MGVGDILKTVGGAASLIPGVGGIIGQGLGVVGSLIGSDTSEEEKKKKAAEEAAMALKKKQEGTPPVETSPTITNPNMAALGQQLNQSNPQALPQGIMPGMTAADLLKYGGRK